MIGNIKLTLLSDDNAKKPFCAEHGFSLAIRWEEHFLLFDTGQGAFVRNAAVDGTDISSFTDCILSHGHYDHTGGIRNFLSMNSHARLWANTKVFCAHYRDADGIAKVLTMSREDEAAVRTLPVHRLYLLSESTRILHNAGILCGIPRIHPLEDTGGKFYMDRTLTTSDQIDDEISLWMEHEKGLVIITGCCHAGFINTCEFAKKVSGVDRIYTVIGGFHLQHASKERIDATCAYINDMSISCVMPCHCTGAEQITGMKKRLGDTVQILRCGSNIVL